MDGALAGKVEVRSLVDALAERLETAIVSGALAPGSRISEQALAASFGVSRGPLREAIRRLEGRKLLIRTANIGVRVAELSLRDLHEILVMREALEGMAAALAAQAMSDAEIADLQALVESHGRQKALREGTGYYQESHDEDFHVRIVRGSGNRRLAELLTGDLYYLLRVYRYRSSTRPGRARAALDEHRAVVEAIARRDGAAAEAAMRAHLRHARQSLDADGSLLAGQPLAAPHQPAI
ncbi:MAG: GntR family transcriptional regulator [Sphingomonadales bacterium]|nr:GntR family transcriptional regulator [Sphingomonadales bacterium]